MRDILCFRLDEHDFGVPADDVIEIERAVATAALPRAPKVIEGVINYRGRVVPVLDLRARFGLPPRSLSASDYLIVARAGDRTVAIRVDRATALHTIEPAQIDPIADITSTACAAGVARLTDGLVVIHDLAAFLSQAEAEALDEAMQAEQCA